MGGIAKVFLPTQVDSPLPPVVSAIAPNVAKSVDKVMPTALLTRQLPRTTADSPGVGLLASPGKTLGGS